jgi:hypothetical protein
LTFDLIRAAAAEMSNDFERSIASETPEKKIRRQVNVGSTANNAPRNVELEKIDRRPAR